MTNEESSFAELGALSEVERILKAEERKVRAELCPEGDGCAVHFRVDGEYFNEGAQYARLVNYVGEYAIFTEDNPEAGNPALLVKAVLGQITREDLPPRWATMIVHVGDGVLGDAEGHDAEERRQAFRYHHAHDEWAAIREEHGIVLSCLKAGLIDVSKPFDLEA